MGRRGRRGPIADRQLASQARHELGARNYECALRNVVLIAERGKGEPGKRGERAYRMWRPLQGWGGLWG